MESEATLPVLVRRAGTRVAKTYSPPLERERSWHVREKSAWFAYLPYLRYLIKEPPESPPSPVIQPPKKRQQENCSINVNIETVQVYPSL